MKKLLALIAMAGCLQASAQSSKVQEYINQYSDLAIREMMRTGVPASITLAQGIVESQYGQSMLVKNTNNHFGIKCKSEWTGATFNYDDDAKGECFRSYNSGEESYIDHSNFLKNRPNYTFLFKLDPTDYEGWAKGLKKAGYATERDYPQTLIATIVRNNLQQYSLLALERMKNGGDMLASNTSASTPAVAEKNTVAESKKETPFVINGAANKEETTAKAAEAVEKSATNNAPAANREERYAKVAQTTVQAPSYPTGTFEINSAKVMFAESGTSLFALANNNNISYKKLLEFNELSDKDILEKDQLIFLEKKGKKGSKDFHIVELNETLADIAQKEGVLLKSLTDFNRIDKNALPETGEKIYLRQAAPQAPRVIKAERISKS
jgi:LysM repeat protein